VLDQIVVGDLGYDDRYDPDDDDIDCSPRGWRRLHLEYVNLLLPTVDALPPVILDRLTRIATRYEPEFVSEIAIRLFAEIVSCDYSKKAVSATDFFKWLINAVRQCCPESQSNGGDAPALMKRWLYSTDPLRMSREALLREP